MTAADKPLNEQERLAALYQLDILDSLPEPVYDDITRIASEICQAPISLISLIDADRQWFKSRRGLAVPQTSRHVSFCAHAILEPNQVFIVPNPAEDPRFADNPLVTGDPKIAFYAGVPIFTDGGYAMGTLCVIDNKPRTLTEAQLATLRALSRQTSAYFSVLNKNNQLSQKQTQLESLNRDLEHFAHIAAHDLKSPLASISQAMGYIKTNFAHDMSPALGQMMELVDETSHAAVRMINGILAHTMVVNTEPAAKEHFTFGSLCAEITRLLYVPDTITVDVVGGELPLYAHRSVLLQILLNLCSNALKYNDKERGILVLTAAEEGVNYSFSVKDNGRGIAEKELPRIFDLMYTLGVLGRNGEQGAGIGLATVKKLVEKMHGAIAVHSEPGLGSSFSFTIRK